MVTKFFTSGKKKRVKVGTVLQPGLYTLAYRIWVIYFPYMSERIVYIGAEADARAEAQRIKEQTKWPYGFKIKEVTGKFPYW